MMSEVVKGKELSLIKCPICLCTDIIDIDELLWEIDERNNWWRELGVDDATFKKIQRFTQREKLIELRNSGKPIVGMCGLCIDISYQLFHEGITDVAKIKEIIRANVPIPRSPPFLVSMYGKSYSILEEKGC